MGAKAYCSSSHAHVICKSENFLKMFKSIADRLLSKATKEQAELPTRNSGNMEVCGTSRELLMCGWSEGAVCTVHSQETARSLEVVHRGLDTRDEQNSEQEG